MRKAGIDTGRRRTIMEERIDDLTKAIYRLANAMEESVETSKQLLEVSRENVELAKSRENRSVGSGLVLVEITREQLDFLRTNYPGAMVAEVTADQYAFLLEHFKGLEKLGEAKLGI
jgi:hypothetical protein